jgi:hypothetical protein
LADFPALVIERPQRCAWFERRDDTSSEVAWCNWSAACRTRAAARICLSRRCRRFDLVNSARSRLDPAILK